MAQHNTDYGLVYNDDGSLCVTKRTDIIPFSGVTSYAVETGTTNLFNNPDFETGDTTNWLYGVAVDIGITSDSYQGNYAGTIIANADNNWGWIGQRISAVSGETYTFSIYVKANKASAVGNKARLTIYEKQGTTYLLPHYLYITLPYNWTRYELTGTIEDTLTDTIEVRFQINETVTGEGAIIDNMQLEKKPFASSFVNGTRPAGRLVRPLNLLGFNPATDDWVVHYWKYPVATGNNGLTSWNETTLGKRPNGCIWWGKKGNSNSFHLLAKYNDGTYNEFVSPNFDTTWYFRHWHHEVVIKHGNNIQYWVDGILQINGTLTKTLATFYEGLAIGGSSVQTPSNSYYANICYGFYTDQWTPEYIQEIYQQRNGFFVPPKAVIV